VGLLSLAAQVDAGDLDAEILPGGLAGDLDAAILDAMESKRRLELRT
jgi:hypothetical protein